MAVSHRLDIEHGIFEIEVDGHIDRRSFQAVIRDMEAEMRAQGRLRVIEIVHRLGWINPLIWLQDVSWSLRHMRGMSRVALVTDKKWLALLANGLCLALPLHFRSFGLGELDQARVWLVES